MKLLVQIQGDMHLYSIQKLIIIIITIVQKQVWAYSESGRRMDVEKG